MSTHERTDSSLTHPNGETIRLSIHPGEEGEDVILYVHGFGSTRKGMKSQALEKVCLAHGWTFAAADFRGHGESSGTLLDLRGSRLGEDLDLVVSHLLDSWGMKRLHVVGSSMGGWASTWLALRRPTVVTDLTLVAPSLNFARSRWDALTEAEREQWQRTGRIRVENQWLDVEIGYGLAEERERYPLARLEKEWIKPLLILHGMQDDTVPYQESIAFAERARGGEIEVRLFKDGDHRMEKYRQLIAEESLRFFTR